MTLVLNHSTGLFTNLTVETLVTTRTRDAAAATEYDPLSNKALIYRAKNALVAIAYSGAAYVGDEDMPTDKWIAKIITGMPAGDLWADVADLGKPFPGWTDIGLSVMRMRDACQTQLGKLGVRPPLEILVSGWQWSMRRKRRLPRRVLYYIGSQDRGRAYRIEHALERHIHPRYQHVCAMPAGNMPEGAVAALTKRLASSVPDAQASLSEMLKAVRRVAKKSDVVGEDCTCVTIAPWTGRIEIDYRAKRNPAVTEMRAVRDKRGVLQPWPFEQLLEGMTEADPVQTASGLAPWILMPNMILAPQTHVGDMELRSEDGLVIHSKARGARQSGELVMHSGFAGLQRKPAPG